MNATANIAAFLMQYQYEIYLVLILTIAVAAGWFFASYKFQKIINAMQTDMMRMEMSLEMEQKIALQRRQEHEKAQLEMTQTFRAISSVALENNKDSFLKLAQEKQIPVVVGTQCWEGATLMHLYDVGKQALDLGVIQAYDMSTECMTTKLMWVINHAETYEEVREMMHTNYTGELNKEGKLY